MKAKITLLLLILTSLTSLYGQIVSPYSQNNYAKNQLGMTKADYKAAYGFFPFSGLNELQNMYDESKFNPPNSVKFSSFSSDSLNSYGSFIEVLSFIPKESFFKVGISVQMNNSSTSDSTQTVQDIAIQKLMNNGGNISVSFERPIYYNEFYGDGISFFLVDIALVGFADIKEVNSTIYNPGMGAQFKLNSDFRIYVNESARQNGNLFRIGTKLGFTQNLFNKEYTEQNTSMDIGSIGYGMFEFYLGLAFFDISVGRVISSNAVFDDRKTFVNLSIVPVKF